jgi:hypothetical protein
VSFYLPRWQNDDHWTRIDARQVQWVKRTEPRYLSWAGLVITGAILAAMYVGFSALVRSWVAWPTMLWVSLLIVGVLVTGVVLLTSKLAQPFLVGISDRGVIFGRLGGEAVEWDQLIRARRSIWGIAVDYPLNIGWWFLAPRWPGALVWSGSAASRYIDGGQFRAILQRPQCPPRLRSGALAERY